MFECFSVVLVLFGEALTAINGPVSTWLEGHLGGAAAAVADHFVHLALATVVVAAVSAAGGAAAGLVLEALFRIERLLRSRENEFGAALAASEGFVGVHRCTS